MLLRRESSPQLSSHNIININFTNYLDLPNSNLKIESQNAPCTWAVSYKQSASKTVLVSVSLLLARCIWAYACGAPLTSKQLCACLNRLFHGQAWRHLVPIKCGWMRLRGRIAKGTNCGLRIQSQVSTFLCHNPGCPIAYFVQHDPECVLLKSSFLFPCSFSYCTSYSSVLLVTFPQHLHLPLFHFPDGCWVSTLTSCWRASAVNCSSAKVDLFNVFRSLIISWIHYWHLFHFSEINFIIYSDYSLAKLKTFAFFLLFPFVCIAVDRSILHTLSLVSLLNFCLFCFRNNFCYLCFIVIICHLELLF